jgi:hypothetical protein
LRLWNEDGKAPSVLEVDARITSFVSWHGQIPRNANVIERFTARGHPAAWVERLISGRNVDYLIGFSLEDRWWALVFDRLEGALPPAGAEVWNIECYDSEGRCWGECYYYWPVQDRWRHQYSAKYGEDFGRHQTAQ